MLALYSDPDPDRVTEGALRGSRSFSAGDLPGVRRTSPFQRWLQRMRRPLEKPDEEDD